MDPLIETLRQFHKPADVMGAEPIDRAALQAALAALAARLHGLYWIRVAMIVAIFIVEIVIALVYREQPAVLAGIAGALGLTIAGSIKLMAAVSNDMSRTGLLLILAGQLDAEAMTHIVQTLVRQNQQQRK